MTLQNSHHVDRHAMIPQTCRHREKVAMTPQIFYHSEEHAMIHQTFHHQDQMSDGMTLPHLHLQGRVQRIPPLGVLTETAKVHMFVQIYFIAFALHKVKICQIEIVL